MPLILSKNFDFESISLYYESQAVAEKALFIDDRLYADLNFEAFFEFVDQTVSTIGQQFLYNKFRRFNINDLVQKTNPIKEELNTSPTFASFLKNQLEKLNKIERYGVIYLFSKFKFKQSTVKTVLYTILSLLSLVSLLLIPLNTNFLFLAFCLFVVNSIVHYLDKFELNRYNDSLTELSILLDVSAQLIKDKTIQKTYPNIAPQIAKFRSVKSFDLYFGILNISEMDATGILSSILELIKIFFLIEPNLMRYILNKVAKLRAEIQNLYEFVGALDFEYCVYALNQLQITKCSPQITENQLISFEEVYHPCIADCTRNSVSLNQKSMLITGSNMSGKTTFMRTVALNVISGQVLGICFAERAEFPKMKIYSSIHSCDDLGENKSYFLDEVLKIKQIIDQTTNTAHQNLILLDELFKGTNSNERILCSAAVLNYLGANHFVMAATHDLELTENQLNRYENYYFSDTFQNNLMTFDYQLKKGVCTQTNATKLLALYDFPREIIENIQKRSQDKTT